MIPSLDTTEAGNPAVTFDEDICATAKQIQWTVSPEFHNMVLRLGGFHKAINFLGVIGKRMEESGIDDLCTESGIYGSNITKKIINPIRPGLFSRLPGPGGGSEAQMPKIKVNINQ